MSECNMSSCTDLSLIPSAHLCGQVCAQTIFPHPLWISPEYPLLIPLPRSGSSKGFLLSLKRSPNSSKGLRALTRPHLTPVLPPALTLWGALLAPGICSSCCLQRQRLSSFIRMLPNLLHQGPVKPNLPYSPEPREISVCVPTGPCAQAITHLACLIRWLWCCLVPLAGSSPRKRAAYSSLISSEGPAQGLTHARHMLTGSYYYHGQ